MKGFGSGYVFFLMVICFFCIVLRRVDWVFGGDLLILLVRSMLVNIGFFLNLNLRVFWLKMFILMMLLGNRLGVNWMCLKLRLRVLVKFFVIRVFVRLGKFFMRMWLLVRIVVSIIFRMFFFLMMIFLILESMRLVFLCIFLIFI